MGGCDGWIDADFSVSRHSKQLERVDVVFVRACVRARVSACVIFVWRYSLGYMVRCDGATSWCVVPNMCVSGHFCHQLLGAKKTDE